MNTELYGIATILKLDTVQARSWFDTIQKRTGNRRLQYVDVLAALREGLVDLDQVVDRSLWHFSQRPSSRKMVLVTRRGVDSILPVITPEQRPKQTERGLSRVRSGKRGKKRNKRGR
jgi:hypothetical protein